MTPGDAVGKALVHRLAGLLPLPAASDTVDLATAAAEAAYMSAFARFLQRNVAAGDPAADSEGVSTEPTQTPSERPKRAPWWRFLAGPRRFQRHVTRGVRDGLTERHQPAVLETGNYKRSILD